MSTEIDSTLEITEASESLKIAILEAEIDDPTPEEARRVIAKNIFQNRKMEDEKVYSKVTE